MVPEAAKQGQWLRGPSNSHLSYSEIKQHDPKKKDRASKNPRTIGAGHRDWAVGSHSHAMMPVLAMTAI